MKIYRNIVLVMLAILAVCIYTAPAHAQTVRQSLGELGWHGVSGDVQVHKPSMQVDGNTVTVWERSALNNQWGNWAYFLVGFDCLERRQAVIATADADGYPVLMSQLTGRPTPQTEPAPGSVPHKTLTAVCASIGYTEKAATQLRQYPTPPDDGGSYNVVIRP